MGMGVGVCSMMVSREAPVVVPVVATCIAYDRQLFKHATRMLLHEPVMRVEQADVAASP